MSHVDKPPAEPNQVLRQSVLNVLIDANTEKRRGNRDLWDDLLETGTSRRRVGAWRKRQKKLDRRQWLLLSLKVVPAVHARVLLQQYAKHLGKRDRELLAIIETIEYSSMEETAS